jgi:hypothetical protein
MAIMELGEHLDAFLQCKLLKIVLVMAAKNKFGPDMLGF